MRPRVRYLPAVSDSTFAVRVDEASGLLAVSGDVDVPQITLLQEAINTQSQSCTADVVLDLSGVTYLPSAAIGMLEKVREEVESSGALFELRVAPGSIVERVLTICAMPHVTM